MKLGPEWRAALRMRLPDHAALTARATTGGQQVTAGSNLMRLRRKIKIKEVMPSLSR